MNPLTLTLSILTIISAGIAIYSKYSTNKILLYVFKPLTTILILLLSILFSHTSFQNNNLLIFIGIIFCLFGDVFLMLHKRFILGLISFLIAHILFLIFFYLKSEYYNYYLLIPVFLIGILLYTFLYKKLGKMKLPVLLYLAFILLMAWSGISFYSTSYSIASRIIAVAVILFVFSDANIAFNKFNKPYRIAELLILSTYYSSIYLIAYSLNFM